MEAAKVNQMGPVRTEQRLRRFAWGYCAGMNDMRRRLITDAAIVQLQNLPQALDAARVGALAQFAQFLAENEEYVSRVLDPHVVSHAKQAS
ncbi:MAG: hypothetical protein ACREF8_02370 [Chthoniobacterales bacterium]